MSYTYLQERGGVSSAECFSDIPAYVLSRLNLTAEMSCCSDKETESCRGSQYGMTCEHSTGDRGEAKSMSCAEDSRVRTLAQPEKAQVLQENDQDSGKSLPGSLAKYDHATHSWRTAQCSLFGGLEPFSEIWPRWGMMQNGECWEVATLGLDIKDEESGSWLPRPIATDVRARGNFTHPSIQRRLRIGKQIGLSVYFKGAPCPSCVERIMGWPIAWTDLKPLETGKIQEWLDLHGRL